MRPDRPVLAALLLAAGAFLAAQSPVSPATPQAPEPAPTAQPSTLAPATDGPAPTGSSAAGWTIVLDPGHGGDDTGVEIGDLREAQLTMDIAREAATTLAAQGVRIVFTREPDAPAGPDARATTANLAHGHAFISLHLNRSPRQAATGAEIYTHVGATDQPDGAFAGAHPLLLVPWDQVQDRHAAASDALATQIETALASRIPMGRHSRQRLPLRTLAGVDMPAVLVELAYLSNPAQAAVVLTPEFQSAVGDALAEALVQARHGAGGTR